MVLINNERKLAYVVKEEIFSCPPRTWKSNGQIAWGLAYLWVYASWLLATTPLGTSKNWEKSFPLLYREVIKHMSSLVGLYHNWGPTRKIWCWTIHQQIRCANKTKCAFRDVPSSQYLRRPTFLKSAQVTGVIGQGYKSLSLSLAYHYQTILYGSSNFSYSWSCSLSWRLS